MTSSDDRIAELIAAALAGELDDAERAELDGLRRDRPWIDEELRDLDALTARLRQGDVSWTPPRDADALRTRIDRAIAAETAAPAAPATPVAPMRRRRWITPLVGAACLVVGLGVGLTAADAASAPPTGRPGTLGSIEPIVVADDVAGVDVDADLVAHTWGTEAILEATGLDVGETYTVVFIGPDGTEFSGGAILGSQVPVVCRVNAAVLRQDATRFEIRDARATVVAHADLPAV